MSSLQGEPASFVTPTRGYGNGQRNAQAGNLFQIVQQMSVFQKIQIGRMGNKEARSLLVRDRNKLVAISVATSPKITP